MQCRLKLCAWSLFVWEILSRGKQMREDDNSQLYSPRRGSRSLQCQVVIGRGRMLLNLAQKQLGEISNCRMRPKLGLGSGHSSRAVQGKPTRSWRKLACGFFLDTLYQPHGLWLNYMLSEQKSNSKILVCETKETRVQQIFELRVGL